MRLKPYMITEPKAKTIIIRNAQSQFKNCHPKSQNIKIEIWTHLDSVGGPLLSLDNQYITPCPPLIRHNAFKVRQM